MQVEEDFLTVKHHKQGYKKDTLFVSLDKKIQSEIRQYILHHEPSLPQELQEEVRELNSKEAGGGGKPPQRGGSASAAVLPQAEATSSPPNPDVALRPQPSKARRRICAAGIDCLQCASSASGVLRALQVL